MRLPWTLPLTRGGRPVVSGAFVIEKGLAVRREWLPVPAPRERGKQIEMKLVLMAVLGISVALAATAADESPLKTQKDKISYMLGMNLGKELKRNSIEVDTTLYLNGMKDAMVGGKMLLSEDEARETMTALQTEMRNKAQEKQKAEGEKGKKEGEAFLVANKGKPGVTTTTNGLQYKVITTGTGRKPGSNDTVVTHYRGTLIDGTEFDSSYKRGEPATFPVTGVIKGWTEALLMMNIGSKWQLVIPSEMAYGERGRPSIPPNSTLLFDIELISIQDPGAATATPPAPPGAPGTPTIKLNPQAPPGAPGAPTIKLNPQPKPTPK